MASELGVFYISYVFILAGEGILRPLTARTWEMLENFCIDYRRTGDRNLDETLLLLFSRSVVSNFSSFSWTVAHKAPLSIGFPRQEYWGGLPFLYSWELSDQGIELLSEMYPTLADGFFPSEGHGKVQMKLR